MPSEEPGWPAAAVAIAFVAAVTTIFVVVYSHDGLDGALKVWGAIGTLVGIVAGAIPSYFFRQTARKAQANLDALLSASTTRRSCARASVVSPEADHRSRYRWQRGQ